VVLKHAPEISDAVMAGTIPLDYAYAEAKQRKEAKASREEQAKRDERDLALLRASAPSTYAMPPALPDRRYSGQILGVQPQHEGQPSAT